MPVKKRFKSLDSFRGLCAISVVLFHMHIKGSITEINFFRGSSLFVEFFFVLSGFVLAHGYAYNKDNIKLKQFITSRFFRIFPLHIFMLALIICFEVAKLIANKKYGISMNTDAFSGNMSAEGIIPNLLLIQAWTRETNMFSFNYPSWSISIEFYMYMLLYVSIVIFGKLRVMSWIIISMISMIFLHNGECYLTNGALRGLSCFFGGSIVYSIYYKIRWIKINTTIGTIAEITTIMLIVIIVSSEVRYKDSLGVFMFFFSVLLFSFESGLVSRVLKIKPFQVAGGLSYSIYMTHALILMVLMASASLIQKVLGVSITNDIDGVKYLTIDSPILSNFLVLITLLVVILMSLLTHKYIELKWMRFGKMHSV